MQIHILFDFFEFREAISWSNQFKSIWIFLINRKWHYSSRVGPISFSSPLSFLLPGWPTRHTGPPPPRTLPCLPDRRPILLEPAAADVGPLPSLKHARHRAPFFPPLGCAESGPHSLSFLSSLWFKPRGDPPLPSSISTQNLSHKSIPRPPQHSALAFCPPRAAGGRRCSLENARRRRRPPPLCWARLVRCSPSNRSAPHPLPFLRAVGATPGRRWPLHASPHRRAPLCRSLLHPSRRPGRWVSPALTPLLDATTFSSSWSRRPPFWSSSSEPPPVVTPPRVRRTRWPPRGRALPCRWLGPVKASFGCGLGRHWQALGQMVAQRCALILISFSNWFNQQKLFPNLRININLYKCPKITK
jgi:hypothetical protein